MTAVAEAIRRSGRRGRAVWVVLALSLTLNVFFIGGLVWSEMGAPPFGPAHHFQQLGRQLDLNDAQRAAFERFGHTVRQHGRRLRESNAPLLQSVWAELAKPNPDQAVIARSVEQADENRRAFQKATAEALAAFMATLTSEQRARFAELAKNRQNVVAHRMWRMILH